jgi:hypothetical protein
MQGIMKAARLAHPLAASTVVALVFAQVYLIAAFIFGDAGALNTHMTLGRVAVGFELLTLVTALLGWRSDRTEVRLGIALVLVGSLQVSLAKDIGNSPGVHALHGLLALAVLALASVMTTRTWHIVRDRFPAPTT